MKVFFKIFSQTLKGGIFFLLPLVIVLVLGKKAIDFIHPVSDAIYSKSPISLPFSAFFISIFLLILICFLAGWLARFGVGNKSILWLEENFLVLFPGYQLMKSTYESKVGLEHPKEFQVVLVPIDGWMIGFLVEELNENEVMVFIPSAPNTWEGNLVIFEKSQIKSSNLKPSDLIAINKRLGVGSKTILSGSKKKPSQDN